MKKLSLMSVALCYVTQFTFAQTGSYTQTLPNMQSVNQATQVIFTNTPPNVYSGMLTCSWLGCQDVGIPNPTFYAEIWINNNWQNIAQYAAASMCGSVPYSGVISGSLLESAIASNGGNSVKMRVWVSDNCVAGVGCSCCNDPLISNLTLSYTYSNALFSVTNTAPCPGTSTQFNDTSNTSFISRKWYFQGGNPATATGIHPTVTYVNSGNYTVTLVRVTSSGTDSTVKSSYIQVPVPPTAIISSGGGTTFCSGGSVLLSANTGAGLTYQWQKDAINIAGATALNYSATTTGSYRVIVTAPTACSSVSNAIAITVNAKPSAVITASGATTFCPGGSVLLSANTGTGFTYVWKKNSSIISGVTGAAYTATATGNYKVTITNLAGCTRISNTISVTVNTPVATASPQGATTFCNGGSVTMSANSGAGLVYQWKKGSTDISGATNASYTAFVGGTYKVVVTNSCGTATSSGVIVTVNAVPAAAITAGGATIFCNGSSVVLSANIGTGLTYQWKKNAIAISGATASTYNASTTGSYTALVTNSNGCTALSNAISVTVNTTSAIITAGGPTTFCQGDSVVLTANSGANLTYQWLKNNTNIQGATLQSYIARTAGNYKVIVTNTATGCPKTSGVVQVVVNCKLEADLALPEADIVPNPFNHSAKIIFKNPLVRPTTVTILNEQQQVIERYQVTSGTSEIKIGEKLASGNYFIQIQSGDTTKIMHIVKSE